MRTYFGKSLGLEPRKTRRFGRRVEDSFPPIPRSQWQEVSLEHLVPAIKDQGSLGYCHSYAGALAGEITYGVQGQTLHFSGTGLGSIVTGSVNRGAALDEVLQVVTSIGYPLEEDVPEYDYKRKNWKEGWKDRAASYKAIEYYDCGYDSIFDKMSTLLQLGFVGVFGCSKPFGPHALVVVGLIKSGNGWKWRIANSWSTSHGDQGYDELAENQIGGINGYGAWGLRANSTVPNTIPEPVSEESPIPIPNPDLSSSTGL